MKFSESDTEIAPGDVFVDDYDDEYVVESVEGGKVFFEDYYPHWIDEVEGFIEDGLWKPISSNNSVEER